MDIYCRYCGEPWDNDILHDMEERMGESMSYLEAVRRFKALGCNAFETDTGMHCTAAPVLQPNVLLYLSDSQDTSDYPDEWERPEDIMCMIVDQVYDWY
tara:strand:+ start:1017 stop:1313 length:297 start_codon:yes stop_codon:yes gene_type:complete